MNRLESMLKGYIPTFKNGKVPTEEVKNRERFYTYDKVAALDSYGGVLENDVVMVDIDDEEQANLLHIIIEDMGIDCNIIETTRGKHFYFRNSDLVKECTNKTSCIGISCMDIKLGINNRIAPLVINGEPRTIIKTVDVLDTIPVWLKPINFKVDFQNLSEGDGRNQTLFNYILTLQQQGMTKEQVKETIKIINKHILSQPIGEKEINTILRDEAFMKATFYNKEGKLQYEILANYLKDEYHIIKINGLMHIYKDGVYIRDNDEIERVLIKYIKNSTSSVRREVLRWLELIAPEKKTEHERYILLKNGIYDVYTETLLDHDPSKVFQNKIDWSYNPMAESKDVDHLLSKVSCGDDAIRALIEEMSGFCLFRRSELGKFFILTGRGSNGKSTILEMITKLLDDRNISSVSMKNLTKRFNAFQLQGKLANIGDDISGGYIDESEDLKKLTTGERMDVEEKGKNAYSMRSYAKLIFSANDIPPVKDTSYGFKRRMMIIPFNADFQPTDADFDPYIKDKVMTRESMEYFLLLSLKALKRVLDNRSFTDSNAVKDQLTEYNKLNNPILEFCEGVEFIGSSKKAIYQKYRLWCFDNSHTPLSSIRFAKQVCNIYGYESRQVRLPDGTREYVFAEKGKK